MSTFLRVAPCLNLTGWRLRTQDSFMANQLTGRLLTARDANVDDFNVSFNEVLVLKDERGTGSVDSASYVLVEVLFFLESL